MHTEVVVHIHNGILTSYKRNTFESVLVRWMNLEPIIQSEVSQKEKEKYHILTHGRLQSMGSLGVGNDWATSLSLFTFMHWRRRWRPTPVFLPGESQGRGAWWAAVCGVTQSRTLLKQLSSSSSSSHPYLTVGKTIALTRRTFVGKVTKAKDLCRQSFSAYLLHLTS